MVSEVFNMDCEIKLKQMETGCIDLLLQDTPFGVTQNDWDIKPDLPVMWKHWERVTKLNGAMIFFATQPFASELILSNQKNFRYDLIWEKDRATGWLNAEIIPMRAHEIILVFYRSLPTYNPQKTFGHKPANASKKDCGVSDNYGEYSKKETGGGTDRFPRSVIYQNVFNAAFDPIHPTQKPVPLLRYLIKTYSNEDDTVFDGYLGSGTTRIACEIENRNFIGCEMNEEYFIKQELRYAQHISQLKLAV